MNEDRKTLDHHFLLWKFDTSKLDHKALHKLDVGLLGNGEAQNAETDYGTEGDETPGGLEGVEKVNSSSCCTIFWARTHLRFSTDASTILSTS